MNLRPALPLAALFAFYLSGERNAFTQDSVSELRAAAERGDADAEFRLSRALLRGDGLPKDPEQSLLWMRKAAEKGQADALGGMGYFYASGVGVAKDEKEAVAWFRKGAEKGSAKAQLNLAFALARGRGVEANEAEALQWFDKAAASHLPEAVYAQGETYFYGQFGRIQDFRKAFTSFQEAAQAGNENAQINLGVMYREGLDVPKDEEKAVQWLRPAANRGNAKAQSNLGHTLGVNASDSKRRKEAIKWVILAANQGEVTAVKTWEELQPTVPEGDLAEIRAAVDEFVPTDASAKN